MSAPLKAQGYTLRHTEGRGYWVADAAGERITGYTVTAAYAWNAAAWRVAQVRRGGGRV